MEGRSDRMHWSRTITSGKEAFHTGLVERRANLDRSHERELEAELLGKQYSKSGLGLMSQEPLRVALAVGKLSRYLSSFEGFDELGDLLDIYHHRCRCTLECVIRFLAELLVAVVIQHDFFSDRRKA